ALAGRVGGRRRRRLGGPGGRARRRVAGFPRPRDAGRARPAGGGRAGRVGREGARGPGEARGVVRCRPLARDGPFPGGRSRRPLVAGPAGAGEQRPLRRRPPRRAAGPRPRARGPLCPRAPALPARGAARGVAPRGPLVVPGLGPAGAGATRRGAVLAAPEPLRGALARAVSAGPLGPAVAHPLRGAQPAGTGRRGEARLLRGGAVRGAVRPARGRAALT